MARALLGLIIVAALIAGFAVTGAAENAVAARHAGADLTRLMRFMAGLKMVLAAVAGAALFWRLGAAVSRPWLAAYGIAAAAMCAGPGLIWNMVHVGLGAVLLHGGLFATLLLLWRDPATAGRLQAALAANRRVKG